MKKTLLLLFLLPTLLYAQIEEKTEKIKRNEINLNAFEVLLGGVIPISYERFISKNQSLGLKVSLLDRHYLDIGSEEYNTQSIQGHYIFYFSERKQNTGFYTSPFLKWTNGNAISTFINNDKLFYKVNAFLLGFGLGYKFLIKSKFPLTFEGNLGRVLNKNNYYNRYGPVEIRIGVNTGIRFR